MKVPQRLRSASISILQKCSLAVQLGATASCSEFAVMQLASKSQVARTSCAGGGAAQREGRDHGQTLRTGGGVEINQRTLDSASLHQVAVCGRGAPYLCH